MIHDNMWVYIIFSSNKRMKYVTVVYSFHIIVIQEKESSSIFYAKANDRKYKDLDLKEKQCLMMN